MIQRNVLSKNMIKQIAMNVLHIFIIIRTISAIEDIHEFLIFENVHITNTTFVKEQYNFQKLKVIRMEKIETRRNIIKYLMNHSHNFSTLKSNIYAMVKHTYISGVCDIMQFMYQSANSRLENLKNSYMQSRGHYWSYNFTYTGKEIIKGSRKAIIWLSYVYWDHHNMYLFENVSYSSNIKLFRRKSDCLSADDLGAMALLSLELYRWHDTSLMFLRGAMEKVGKLIHSRKLVIVDLFMRMLVQLRQNILYISHNESNQITEPSEIELNNLLPTESNGKSFQMMAAYEL